MKNIILSVVILFLLGCGGGGGSSDTQIPEDTTPSIILPIIEELEFEKNCNEEPLCYQQWYMSLNDAFYSRNSIDKNASINPGNVYDKYSGRGVVIAIIDDALDTEHSEFRDNILATYNIKDGSLDVSAKNYTETHGTQIAGIIASSFDKKGLVGIAPNCKLIFIKIGDSNTASEYIEAFEKARELGADIISNSWGTYNVPDGVRDKINDLANNGRGGKGIIIVFSSGNEDKDIANDESSVATVLAVGSSNRDNQRSYYSNYGKALDILTPGGEYLGLTTTDLSSIKGVTYNDYIEYDNSEAFIGTSASAPVLSASIALILQANPNLTRENIFDILKQSSDKIGDYSYDTTGHNIYYGYGKLNLSKAIELAVNF